jgi:hypothetical protein
MVIAHLWPSQRQISVSTLLFIAMERAMKYLQLESANRMYDARQISYTIAPPLTASVALA